MSPEDYDKSDDFMCSLVAMVSWNAYHFTLGIS